MEHTKRNSVARQKQSLWQYGPRWARAWGLKAVQPQPVTRIQDRVTAKTSLGPKLPKWQHLGVVYLTGPPPGMMPIKPLEVGELSQPRIGGEPLTVG